MFKATTQKSSLSLWVSLMVGVFSFATFVAFINSPPVNAAAPKCYYRDSGGPKIFDCPSTLQESAGASSAAELDNRCFSYTISEAGVYDGETSCTPEDGIGNSPICIYESGEEFPCSRSFSLGDDYILNACYEFDIVGREDVLIRADCGVVAEKIAAFEATNQPTITEVELPEECDENPALPQCFTNTTNVSYGDLNDNPIYRRLNQIIAFLSVGVGIAVAGSVIFAGIQWSVSGGNPQTRSAAINRLWMSAIALVIYVFGWAILNWLIPGGPL